MHAAPGGQTGQNIDDSERDLPELFMRPEHRDELCALWALLAARYRGEAAVAGFDLLNEPLIRKDAEHNGRLVPLYLRITEAVRRADPERIVIWEGAHWATDFSVFDALEREDLPENLVLQFHKYWSTPRRGEPRRFSRYGPAAGAAALLRRVGREQPGLVRRHVPAAGQARHKLELLVLQENGDAELRLRVPEPERWGELLEFSGRRRASREAAGDFQRLPRLHRPRRDTPGRPLGALPAPAGTHTRRSLRRVSGIRAPGAGRTSAPPRPSR